jgi:protocatechuate 3,4-dioxygenase beta subunit
MEPNERLKAICDRTVEKLKEVVHEFKITQDELHLAGDYLNRLGEVGMCRSLVDVALAMTSIDALGLSGEGTRQNLEGPYHADHPVRADGSLLDRVPPPGAPRLVLSGTVFDAATGKPAAGALLDFWQADSEGRYDRTGSHLRGIVVADKEGRYSVSTVVPDDYSEHDHDPIGELFRAMGRLNTRAAHIHLKVTTGDTERLTTQLFMPTSSFLERDYVEGAVSGDLVIAMTPVDGGYVSTFDIVLSAGR